MGASAGGHLAALAALSGKKFTGGYPQDPFASTSAEREGADRRLWRL
jgi:acetyl esterase/lipase